MMMGWGRDCKLNHCHFHYLTHRPCFLQVFFCYDVLLSLMVRSLASAFPFVYHCSCSVFLWFLGLLIYMISLQLSLVC